MLENQTWCETLFVESLSWRGVAIPVGPVLGHRARLGAFILPTPEPQVPGTFLYYF